MNKPSNQLIACPAREIVGGDKLAITKHDPEAVIEVLEANPDKSDKRYVWLHMAGGARLHVMQQHTVYRLKLEGES